MKTFLSSRKDKKSEAIEKNEELEYFKWQIRDLNRKIRDFAREIDEIIKNTNK